MATWATNRLAVKAARSPGYRYPRIITLFLAFVPWAILIAVLRACA